MNVILIGDDFPAVQLFKLLTGLHQPHLKAVYTTHRETGFGQLGELAAAAGIPCKDSTSLKSEAEHQLLACLQIDWLINVNSTVILPDRLLELPAGGALNMHPGLLPEYAGLHTHQWALRNGEEAFGSTIHYIKPALDTGDIILQEKFPITAKDTGLSLYHKCIRSGTQLMKQVVQKILAGEPLPRFPQDLSRRHLYRHRDALDGRIDWTWTAGQIERFVRAGNYAPFLSPTYTAWIDTSDGVVELLQVEAVPSSSTAAPGSVIHIPENQVCVQCAATGMVALSKTRWKNGGPVATESLFSLLPQGFQLAGRSEVKG
ncbi:MAG: hypothetical protein JXA25_20780 [Anaerolineales bacterium]|nr:hypothetical protein [Anaerolineales bacterium]